ncbi:uncharacterized protein LOC134821045 [Bolinopsis microptera]|uniref:uncharacterized protein LOC134821045 n=1 Tax=Bolinopsis microptera TaxID=2820187 RepID=UPI00307A1E9F
MMDGVCITSQLEERPTQYQENGTAPRAVKDFGSDRHKRQIIGGKRKWRSDGKCGRDYRLPDNSPAQCDPDGEYPCCSDWLRGVCSNTTNHCSCTDCVDYSVIYRDWRESGGKRKWRSDGRCGIQYPLPDNSPAQCDPDGENPCCSQWRCGNTADHCSCYYCIDYSVIYRDWRESGGKIKWRYDGGCGSRYPLPDNSPAECNPDGENPCCSYRWGGMCGNTARYCSCSNCVNYSIVSELRKSGENCTVTTVGGFLKNVYFNEEKKRYNFKCTHSDVYFENEDFSDDIISRFDRVTSVCENDSHVYQACGFNTEITNTDVLCGGLFCNNTYKRCDKNCSVDNVCSVKHDPQQYTGTSLCNDKCEDTDKCIDESDCNGYKYGFNCTYEGKKEYVPVHSICNGYNYCAKEEDEQDYYTNTGCVTECGIVLMEVTNFMTCVNT